VVTGSAEADGLDVEVLLQVLTAYRNGDFSVRMPSTWTGLAGKVADVLNEVIGESQRFAWELQRLARTVGKEGRINQRLFTGDARGEWAESRRAVDDLVEDLVSPHVEVAQVIEAVARGDLSQTVPMDVEGRPLQGQFAGTARTVNRMVSQLSAFASEVTRVAREVGTEGKLGGQAEVPGVSGVWKDLTDNVNSMARNLTAQVRNVAEVTTAVANGDLSRKVTVDVQGEILDLKSTINVMVDQLNAFASEVTRVAREVGTEGKLGGQAEVPEVSGIWKDLTDNVNQLAATLTNQIRAITDVATAVTQGDLTRSIGVEASGEVAILKDKINEMIRNLRETTRRNAEQDWLKTNLARFTRMLQGQRDLTTACELVLSELAPLVGAQHGALYTLDGTGRDRSVLKLQAAYACREDQPRSFRVGEGLVGQCAVSGERILTGDLPPEYITITSGLGQAAPRALIVLPIAFEDQILGVLELASLQRFSPVHLDFLEQLTESIGIVLHTIEVNMRTQALLEQSQSLAYELQVQQEELRQANEELQEKARLLAERNIEVERKNHEVEQARRSLEEKAEQLALTSQYKSQFLANMSHELRTPLNSLLILAQQLVENSDGNLSPKQVEFARIIHASGQDLLNLITDILDLSKVESGTVVLEVGEERFDRLVRHLERSFRHLADSRQLAFEVSVDPELPARFRTDSKRLQQVLRNLLSNAFKFTERGRVELRIRLARGGWDSTISSLERAHRVVAFDVIDTGIGIPADKQRTIFEAFQQADGTTSRKYGGTGLGLSISRELVHLLGGQITVRSVVGMGSTFTVYLPLETTSAPPGDTEAELAGRADGATALPPAEHGEGDGILFDLAMVSDDRDRLAPGDPVVLIVDDDLDSCRLLLDLVRRSGFKGVVATRGHDALSLARAYRPAAVALGVGPQDRGGWEVLEELRSDPLLGGVPVVVVAADEERRERLGDWEAVRVVPRPLLDEELQELLAELMANPVGPPSGAPASLPDPEETTWAQARAQPDPALAGRMVLVVDDDVRNVFALTAMLEQHGLRVIPAEGGQQALEALRASEQVDLVLLDIMMPDLDGYETIRRIRRDPRFADLPIIALTAKAMKGDRERCLEAGASDYVAKPVEPPELLAILRSRLQSVP
jgi:signal transduction histidine kinase/CheY-like chemotaxis protein/HAMP domain-containing protein